MPQLHHTRAKLRLVGGELARREGVFRGARRADRGNRQRQCLYLVAACQQLGDVAFGVQNAFALHFGWVGRQHRRYKAVRQRAGDGFGCDTGPAQARQSDLDAAFLRVAGAFMHSAAANVVAVFGQVGKVAEIGERADHTDGLVAAQAFEQFFEGLVGLLVGIAPEGY